MSNRSVPAWYSTLSRRITAMFVLHAWLSGGAQILLTGSDIIANAPGESAALLRADVKNYGELIKTLDIRVD